MCANIDALIQFWIAFVSLLTSLTAFVRDYARYGYR